MMLTLPITGSTSVSRHLLFTCWLLIYLPSRFLWADLIYPDLADNPTSGRNALNTPMVSEIRYSLNGEVIDDEIVLERLSQRTEVNAGAPVSRDQVRRSIEAIYRLGPYAQITALHFPADSPNHTILVFQMTSRKQCGKVELVFGVGRRKRAQLSMDLCRAILHSRSGIGYTPNMVASDVERLKSLHREHGYFGARVYSSVEETSVPTINLRFHIDAGKPTTINRLQFTGNLNLKIRTLSKLIKSKTGTIYNQRNLTQDVDTLVRKYRKEGYLTVEIEVVEQYRQTENQIGLNFYIQEGPLVIFRGESNLKDVSLMWKEVVKEINLYRQDNYSSFTLRGNARRIQQFYQQRGYLDPQITYQINYHSDQEPVSEDKPEQVEIIFRIETDPPPIIDSITLVGNQAFSYNQLLANITMRPQQKLKAWIGALLPWQTRQGFFNPIVFEQDRRAIELFYRQYGFNEIAVTNQKELDNQNRLHLTFICQEGKQQFVQSVQLEGNTVFLENDIHQWLKVKPGTVYNTDSVTQDQLLLQSKYDEMGYIYATVDPIYERANEVLRYQISEKQSVKMGALSISGNLQTKSQVMAREFETLDLHQGETLSLSQLDQIKQRLFMLGLFRSVEVDLPNLRQQKEIQDVNLSVDEKKTRGVSLSGGYNPLDRLRATVELVDYNLYGRNLRAGMKVRISRRGNLYEATLVEPWFIGKTIGTFRLFEDNLEERESVRARGGTINLAKQTTSLYSNLALQYKYQELQYQTEWENVVKPTMPGNLDKIEATGTTVSSLGVSFRRDNRDRFLDPENGWLNELAVEYAGGFIGGKTSFIKLTTDHRYFRKIYGLVLANAVRAGYTEGLRSNRENPIISFERFYAGGSTTVRGYAERSLGPADTQRGDAMLVLNSELRFPIYKPVNGTFFFDAGNVWDRLPDVSKIPLRIAIGIGLRVDTPLGPVRFDYAYPFTTTKSLDTRPQTRTYLELGQAF
ncbi:MAG: outer membrane protein assembly factor BamA [Candidatus Poribacteria bacterium]|nr:outer membrane protein assembly factor BamA [Candidatus Poribacteria bacterium]